MSKKTKVIVGDRVEAIKGDYANLKGYITKVCDQKVYVRFDSGIERCLWPMSLKIVLVEHLEADPDAFEIVESIDYIVRGLFQLGLDDDDIHALIDRRVGSVRGMSTPQSSNDL